MKIRIAILVYLMSMLPLSHLSAKEDKESSKEAKELFTKVYDMVFGEKGSCLSYSVNIIGIYKTAGDIAYKGKKIHYQESRYSAWEDGVTAYMVDKKKKVVNVYDYDDDNKDEYLSKFKYDVNNFIISYKAEGDYYLITAKIKDASYFGIREAVAKVYKKNLHPVSLTIKLAFFKTTVKISNFRSGNIPDNVFVFPKRQFSDYTLNDHRK